MPPDSSMDDPGDNVVDGCGIIFPIILAAWWDSSTNESWNFRDCVKVLNSQGVLRYFSPL